MALEQDTPRSRIALVVSSMQIGGAERVAAVLCNEWVELGHDVHLLVTYSSRGACAFALDDRVHVIFLADHATGRIARLRALRKEIRERGIDRVISFMTLINVATLVATLRLGVRVVVSERTYPPAERPSGLIRSLRRWLYPRAHRVVLQTQQGLDWLSAQIPNARGVVIGNPLKLPLPDSELSDDVNHRIPEEASIILGIGRLVEDKGFMSLVDAFAKIEDPHGRWHLAILGEGPQRGALERRIEALGLERAHLIGAVENIARWYDRADVFVLASTYEGFPNALLEAMGLGITVIANDCDTGPRDLIEPDVNGILLEGNAPDVIAQGLNRVLADPSLRATLGSRATEAATAHDATRIARRWLEI